MANWKEGAKRLRENQEKNQRDYAKQATKSEERIMFLKRIEDEKARQLSNARRKRNFETPIESKYSEKEL